MPNTKEFITSDRATLLKNEFEISTGKIKYAKIDGKVKSAKYAFKIMVGRKPDTYITFDDEEGSL